MYAVRRTYHSLPYSTYFQRFEVVIQISRHYQLHSSCYCVEYVDGSLTNTPSNTAVVSGDWVRIQCSSNISGSSINWQFTTGLTYVVRDCIVQYGYTDQFVIDTSTVGHCDLIIISATTSVAGFYMCQDSDVTAMAYLVVLCK